MARAKPKKWAAESLVSETESKATASPEQQKMSGDARKAPKVHPMLAAARKRKPDPTGGHPITPERPKLRYKKGKGVYNNSVRSPNW